MGKADMGMLCALWKEFQREETLVCGGPANVKIVFQNFLSCKGRASLLVSGATGLCSATHGGRGPFRQDRLLYGKRSRVEAVMIELGTHGRCGLTGVPGHFILRATGSRGSTGFPQASAAAACLAFPFREPQARLRIPLPAPAAP